MTRLDDKRRDIERKARVREFVFGIQDGLISTLGLLSGMQSATSSRQMVVLTGLTAALTGALSMSVGSYLSSQAEKEIFDKELKDQEQFVEEVPYLAQEGLLSVLEKEGMGRDMAYRVVKLLREEKSVFIQTFQEKVLGLGSADITNPLKGAMVMALSFIAGAFVPMAPYWVAEGSRALGFSVGLSVLTLFGVGCLKGLLAKRNLLVSGMKFFAIALAAAAAGCGIGWGIEKIFHTTLSSVG